MTSWKNSGSQSTGVVWQGFWLFTSIQRLQPKAGTYGMSSWGI